MSEQPNIVLVTVDSFRADHCSFMGYEHETTPALDVMAEEGAVFTNAIAPGPTTPESLPATMTGTYPTGAGSGDELASTRTEIRDHVLAHDTLAEKLSRRGYATGAFTPNPWTSRYFGFDRGFDRFEDFMGDDLSSSIWSRMLEEGGSKALAATRLVLSWMQRENVFKPWSAMYDDIVSWAQRAEKPYFLWVFLLDVHFPYLTGDTYRSQSRWREYEANLRLYLEDQHTPYSPRVHEQLVTAYDDSIRYTDAFFERLRSDVEDTVIVVHGDHGEAFGEHGTYTHQHQLYRENIHVPLVVSGVPSRRIDRPISLRAIPRLLTGIAETGAVPDIENPFVAARTDETAAIDSGRVKYLRNGDGEELYDIGRDEQSQVSNDQLGALCRGVLAQFDASMAEQRTIGEAAREVVRER
ncbi:sulfatase [Halococcus saccharolyticus]|uniref:Arylsulfatase A family protein n=1 Tax=Halococcus saccharolyticus DSM 5350 TaxID=1227455 RepID=M0MGH3_9EURY|nr:sulfatase [Halococcus saccharolyticus]EMA44811.1 arylsulfatase A family protein [Halococcus saccharolyticus DSM 5350]